MVYYGSVTSEDVIMNKIIKSIITTTALLLVVPVTQAGLSEVTWTEPDSYVDIRHGTESKKSYQKHVFTNLEKHIAEIAEKLPEGQTLKMDFKDVDLAGDVRFGTMDRIRVVKDMYSPRLEFSYKVVDKDGNVISEGEENIRDMNFLYGQPLKYKNESFGYEKKILDDWFKDTFESKS